MSDERKERRKSRRVATVLGGILAFPGDEPIEVETSNLSAGGVFVSVPRYFPPFTKVQLALILPPFGQALPAEDAESAAASGSGTRNGAGGDAAGGDDAAESAVKVEGIVVRCEPEPGGAAKKAASTPAERYSVAISFLHLEPAVRERIEAYVTWRLERSLIESAGSLGRPR